MKQMIIFASMTLGVVAGSFAQNGYNQYSVKPVHSSDIMYKKVVWRAMDLREKQNSPLYSKNNELSTIILTAFQQGKIKAYQNDSLTHTLSWNDAENRLVVPSTDFGDDTIDLYMEHGADWRKIVPPKAYFSGRDLYQIELKEEVVFDKEHSRMYRDIQTLTIYFPADHPENTRGIQVNIATFSYKDLVDKVFTDNPKAIWINQENDASNKNLADAFELNLFSSYIVKISNGKDQYLSEKYMSEYKGLLAAQSTAAELMEFEHHLWEY